MVWNRIFLRWKFSPGNFWWLNFSANKAVLEKYIDRSGSRILQKGGSGIKTNRLLRICSNMEGILSHFHLQVLQIFHFKLIPNETSIKKHLGGKITRFPSTVLKQLVQTSRDFGLVWSQLCQIFLNSVLMLLGCSINVTFYS